MSEDTAARLSGALRDRYAIEGEIDRGGMAVVYLALDLKHSRKVAVKILNPSLSAVLGTERFLREIDVIAKLQHPHVLTLIDSGQVDGMPYYVMPYFEGQSLRARLEREGALPADEALRIAAEIADALAYAHDHGVVHRDIKPGNVLLSGGHAIVADFGIAAALDQAQVGRLTDTGVSLGSPAYMSPEQASGDEVDGRTDVYALGCILYEMLSGQPPFEGSLKALLPRKVLGKIRPLEELRPELPTDIRNVVSRAMETEPHDRFDSAHAMRDALLAARPRSQPASRTRRRTTIAAAAVLSVAILALVIVQRTREAGRQALWAMQQLAEVERLVDAGQLSEALALATEVEAVLPQDTVLARLLPRFTFTTDIRTDPPGARVSIQAVDAPEYEWHELGTTPLEGVRFAGLTYETEAAGVNHASEPQYRVRLELDGYQERELYLTAIFGVPAAGLSPMDPVALVPEDSTLHGMVPIPGFTSDGVEYADYYMDRYEVTNAQFKEFVDAGGYSNREYWVRPFELDGRELEFDEAIARFEDQTGRPGPSTWRLGTYAEGTADYPVGGVSWYEAAAYSRWAGKNLPTTTQWARGLLYYRDNAYVIVPKSNLGTDGPRPVGQNRAMTTLGVYDLAGNVREWCYNEVGSGQRATRGAAWPDAPFHVEWIIPRSPFDRDATHGFRLIRTFDDDAKLTALREPVSATVERDYSTETPAPDPVFEFFRRLYDYDPVPLNSVVERTDTTEYWTREVVAFDLPYGERGGAVVYLPTGARGALQPVIYWGGAGLTREMRSTEEEFTPAFDFIVRSGRSVVVPIFSAGYGRPDPRPAATQGRTSPLGRADHGYRDIAIRWQKELRTTIDYLETRPDIDTEFVGFYGFSFGGRVGPIALAVEPRLDAAVLNVGGLATRSYPLPEVDPFNFAPRVTIPVLMINGEYDVVFPYETSQKPLFDLLGTDPEHKRHHVSPAAHFVPRDELIRETLDWLDRYLGVPGR